HQGEGRAHRRAHAAGGRHPGRGRHPGHLPEARGHRRLLGEVRAGQRGRRARRPGAPARLRRGARQGDVPPLREAARGDEAALAGRLLRLGHPNARSSSASSGSTVTLRVSVVTTWLDVLKLATSPNARGEPVEFWKARAESTVVSSRLTSRVVLVVRVDCASTSETHPRSEGPRPLPGVPAARSASRLSRLMLMRWVSAPELLDEVVPFWRAASVTPVTPWFCSASPRTRLSGPTERSCDDALSLVCTTLELESAPGGALHGRGSVVEACAGAGPTTRRRVETASALRRAVRFMGSALPPRRQRAKAGSPRTGSPCIPVPLVRFRRCCPGVGPDQKRLSGTSIPPKPDGAAR